MGHHYSRSTPPAIIPPRLGMWWMRSEGGGFLRGFCGRAGRGGAGRLVRQVFQLRLFAEQATMAAPSSVRSADSESSISLFRPCFLCVRTYVRTARIFPVKYAKAGWRKRSVTGGVPLARSFRQVLQDLFHALPIVAECRSAPVGELDHRVGLLAKEFVSDVHVAGSRASRAL